jgi:hypothetical protein
MADVEIRLSQNGDIQAELGGQVFHGHMYLVQTHAAPKQNDLHIER